MPLRHLIVLIVDAHPSAEVPGCWAWTGRRTHLKDQLQHCSNDGAVSTRRRRLCETPGKPGIPRSPPAPLLRQIEQCSIHDVRQQHAFRRQGRPHGRHETGISRTILRDTILYPSSTTSLSQKTFGEMVEPDGIEPTTSCLQSTRSPN